MLASTARGDRVSGQRTQSPATGLWSITLLRGLAALWVALSHGDGLWWRQVPGLFFGHAPEFFSSEPLLRIVSGLLFGMGFLGVPLFFVISGFCIHLPQAGKSDPLNLRSFAVRRFFRIYPLYIVVVIVAFVLFTISDGWGSTRILSVPNALGHLVFWHYADGGVCAGMGITPLMWTLAIEVHFYVLYALTLPWLRRFGLGRCAAIALGIDIAYRATCYATGLFYSENLPGYFFPARFSVIRFGEWLLGAWVAERYATGRIIPSRSLLRPILLVAGGMLCVATGSALCAAFGLRTHTTDVPACLGFMLVLLGMLSWELARRDTGIGQGLWARLATAVGERSYSLYLVHLTVMAAVLELWVRLRHIADKNAGRGSAEYLFAVLAGLAISFVVAEITYRLIEVPSHRLARRLAKNLENARKANNVGEALASPVQV